MTSAQGFDASSYQVPITPAQLAGYDFAWAKVSDGASEVDPHFAANWHTIGAGRLHRGGYHELTPDNPQVQAEHFLAVIKDGGVRPGDMAACVASDYAGVTSAEVAGFCSEVRAGLGGKSPVLVYTSLSVGASLTSCTGFDLWCAHPGSQAPTAAQVRPWKTWRFWQWSFGGARDGGDRDAYNGTRADLDAWIATYAGPKPIPQPDQDLEVYYMSSLLLPKGRPTPIRLNPDQTHIGFTAVTGSVGSFPAAQVQINWHGSDAPVAVDVNPHNVWPVDEIPAGQGGFTVFRMDTGSHDVAYEVW